MSRRSDAQGLRITGPVEEFSVAAPAFLPEEMSGTWQHIFLAVKAQHTEAATRALTPHLAQDGYVLSLQNGLNETDHPAHRRAATARSAPSSTSAPTGWRRARSCSAIAARWCWANSTAR